MYLYPVWVRLWHVLNAILIIILIITGISMQYTDKENYVLIVDFARAVKWHNIAAVILTISFIFFVIMNIRTENGKYYRLSKKNFFSDLGKQLRYYSFGMFRRKNLRSPFPLKGNSILCKNSLMFSQCMLLCRSLLFQDLV